MTSGCGNRFWEDTKDTVGNTYDYVFDSTPTARSFHHQEEIPIIEINYAAADVLYSNTNHRELAAHSPVYVETFTNRNNPADTSIFGGIVTEQVADRLVQRGIVISAGTPEAHEYFLPHGTTKEMYTDPIKGTVATLPPRSGKLTGYYVLGDSYIYVNAKITRLDDHAIIAGHNWTIPITNNIRAMLPQLSLPENGLKPSVKTHFQ